MGMFFDNLEAACVWLVTNGWRQNDEGVWLKGKMIMAVRRSPAGDGVVSLTRSKAA